MSTRSKRTEFRLSLLLVPLGLIPAAIVGLWAYMGASATPLHPDPAAAPSVARRGTPPKWATAVGQGRDAVRVALSQENLPGLSVAVGVGGEVVWAEGFGWADLDRSVPMTPQTRFRLGTASTALTSVAAGTLVDEGRLLLDEDVRTYVPAFPEQPSRVTLRHVMAHTSGVRNDGGDEGPLLSKQCEDVVEGIEAFGDRPLLFEPGTRFRYSSYGWILVSAAIEAVAGAPFLDVMRDRVFEPLGLRDTSDDRATELEPNRATSYFPRFAADPRYGLHLMRPLDYSCYAGASIFVSTPSDLVRFAMALRAGEILQPTTLAVLHTPQLLTSGEETPYGLGWDVVTVEVGGLPTRAVGVHGTLLGGRVATLLTLPDRDITVAVLSNISYADTEALAVLLARAFAGR